MKPQLKSLYIYISPSASLHPHCIFIGGGACCVQDIVKASEVEDAHTQLQKATARLCRRLHIEQEIPCYRYIYQCDCLYIYTCCE